MIEYAGMFATGLGFIALWDTYRRLFRALRGKRALERQLAAAAKADASVRVALAQAIETPGTTAQLELIVGTAVAALSETERASVRIALRQPRQSGRSAYINTIARHAMRDLAQI